VSKLKIKMVSKRSGNVAWIRDDGTPSNYEGEAGHFDGRLANLQIKDYRETLERVVGRCAWNFTLIPVK
jgi:hypothetical protein